MVAVENKIIPRDLDADRLIEIIDSIVVDPDCSLCPNLPNKPDSEGCGMDTCFMVIEKLLEFNPTQ